MEVDRDPKRWLYYSLSCLTHVLIILPTIFIVVLCIRAYSLFAWHPACFAIGCGLLMTEAILAISGDALLASRVTRVGRIRIHTVFNAIGLLLVFIGFATVIANKIRTNSTHFGTDHAKVGLAGIIFSCIVALGGVLTSYSGLLAGKVSLANLKLIHVCGGIITLVLMFYALLTGINKNWWPSNNTTRILSLVAYIIALILVLIKPLYSSLIRIRSFFI